MSTETITSEDTLKNALGGMYTFEIVEKAKKKDEVVVKGFASLQGTDRDGDNIDPALFDIEAYMKNPTVLWQHNMWKRKNGNEVPIGKTLKMNAVEVAPVEGDVSKFNLMDLHTGEFVEEVDVERYLVKSGDRGLFVHVQITEPDVVEMVHEKLANAFSWKGALRKSHASGRLSIDMWEVSVVNVPGNGRSLFTIAKSIANALNGLMATITSDMRDVWLISGNEVMIDATTEEAKYAVAFTEKGFGGVMFMPHGLVRTVEEARAVAKSVTAKNMEERGVVLLKPTGKRTMSGSDIFEVELVETEAVNATDDTIVKDKQKPTGEELSLLKRLDMARAEAKAGTSDVPVENTRAVEEAASLEGGEDMDQEAIMKAINGVATSVGELGTKVDNFDKRQTEFEKKLAEREGTGVQAEVVTKTVETPAPATSANEVAKATEGAPASSDFEKKLFDAISGIDSKVGDVSKRVDELNSKQDTFEKRLGKVEDTPTTSRAAVDDDAAELAEYEKRFNALPAEERAKVEREVGLSFLGMKLGPPMMNGAGR